MNTAGSNLRESHAHLFQLGRSLTMADLSACTSRLEAIERLTEHAKMLDPDGWVLAHGMRPDGWDDRSYPTRSELDHACDGRAVCAWSFDYHALTCSSSALAAAGIDRCTTIEHGQIVFDDAGEPTGELIEHAALHLWNTVPEPHESQRHRLIRDACAHLGTLGFIEVHDLKAQPWLGSVMSDLLDAGEISMRASLFPLIADLDATLIAQPSWNRSITLGGIKVFTDGTINSRTAWMLDPFTDGAEAYPSGTPMMTPDEISDACCLARSHNLPIAAHAIGDGAVRAVLDSIESTRCDHMGCRIEHAEVVHPDDVARFHSLGVIASVQPCHLLTDIEAINRSLGDRLDRILPIKSWLDSGLIAGETLVFGSDVPIVRADPQDSILASVCRRRADMHESKAINPSQAISQAQAWACFK